MRISTRTSNTAFPVSCQTIANNISKATIQQREPRHLMRWFSFLLVSALMMFSGVIKAQQVIGSFPTMDGGFENQTPGAVTLVSSVPTGTQRTDWTINTAANVSGTGVFTGTGGRSGPKYVTYGSTGTTARRLQSPTATPTGAIVNATAYTVQYYYRTPGAVAATNGQRGISPDGTAQPGTYSATAMAATSGTWSLIQVSQTSGSSAANPKYGIGIIRFNTVSTVDIDVDDFVIYAGAADNTAANSAGTVTVNNPTLNSLDVSWVSASGGVDGGGYVVVRYATLPNADNDPNQRGIYAVGNTTTNGTGSLTGTIVYIGTGNSFTDGSLASNTSYYYKVYTVDKAFNYAAESEGNNTTTAPATNYTLTYTAGPNGSISGTSPQTVASGANGTAVTAVANTCYHFVDWSDASTQNPRTDLNVTGDITVTANFAANGPYTFTYTAGANGSVTGTSPQTGIACGGSGTAVSAVANTGYHFVNWSDASTQNPRTDINAAGDITVTANFAINTYTLTYTAGANGSISGTSPQTVNHGADGTAVTAVANSCYHFVDWSDASTQNPRTDLAVTGDITVTANFAADVVAAPSGSASQSFCGSATVADLVATGSGVQWYDADLPGGVLLSSGTALVNGNHYFASQTVSGCASTSRLDVTATVMAFAPAPTVTGPICPGATVVSGTSTEADGTVINVVVNNIPMGSTTVTGGAWTMTGIDGGQVTPGVGVYATTFIPGMCVSNSSNVVTVSNNVTAGTISGSSTACFNSVTSYTTDGTPGGTWSITNGSGTATVNASNGDVTGTGQGSVTLTYTVNSGCGSPVASNKSLTITGIDYANLQWPPTATITEGGTYTAYGQVYETGVTEPAGQGAGIDVEFGYNNANTNPSGWSNWVAATYNNSSGNNDEYMATSGAALTAGTYYYTFRYRLTGCTGWVYGGINATNDGNFWDGVTFKSGVLTVNAAPPVTYTVTYDGNGNDGGTAPVDGSSPYVTGSTVTVLGAGSLTRTGYTFNNWNTASDGSGTSYAPAATFTITSNTTLYAQWTLIPPVTYTMTYDGNGNDGGTAPVDPNSPYISGAAVTVLGQGTLTRTGYTFNGWNTTSDGSGTSYAPATSFIISANTILYAQWTLIPPVTYTVTYDGNGSDGGTAPVDGSSPYVTGSTVTVLGQGSLTRTGYTFNNWNTASDGSGTSYAPAATFTITSNTTLYAQWTLIPPVTYTLTYTAGPNGSITGTSPQTVVSGGSGTPVTAVANAGYHFVNWSDASTSNPRTDVNVTADITVTANFATDCTGAPTVDPITGTTTLCAGSTSQLTSSPTGGVWSSDNAGIASVDVNGLVTAISAGTTTVHYAVTNLCGTTTVNATITVGANPIVITSVAKNASMTNVLGTGGVTTFPAGCTYLWNTGETGNYIKDKTPGTYTVTITAPNGCVKTKSITIN